MDRLTNLKVLVSEIYLSKNKNRADWSDWLFENHVFVVAEETEKLCERFKANKDLAVAAAMLHDIGDAVISRFDSRHEEESFRIAKSFLEKSDFKKDEIETIIEDIIKLHSCRTAESSPKTLEGKIMATADAVVHLKTDFYDFGVQSFTREKSLKEALAWALPKIERDFKQKIFFDEVREENREFYESLKKELSILV